MMASTQRVPSGVAAAAVLAAGIGTFVLGLNTTLAEASERFAQALNWYPPAGALSGKTTLAVLIWLIAWAVLHRLWKDRELPFPRIFGIALVLIGLGLLLMFPPFFELFAE